MIRTDTTLIVGAGANREIEMPDGPELLNKIASGYEFERLNADVKSRDLITLANLFQDIERDVGHSYDELVRGAVAIRDAVLVSTSIEEVIEQYAHDAAVHAAAKVAIVYYTMQAESKSTLAAEPRAEGELPLRGTENWLFQLGQLIIKGVPRSKAEKCFDQLSIIAFTYDRAIEHYLPWVIQRAFGMSYEEACQLVDTRLRIVHPYGVVGALPWQGGDDGTVGWGEEEPANIALLSKRIVTASELDGSAEFKSYLQGEMAHARRIGFVGFGFEPINTAMLFDGFEQGDPDLLANLVDVGGVQQKAILRMVEALSGITDESRISLENMKAFELLRDYGRFLES